MHDDPASETPYSERLKGEIKRYGWEVFEGGGRKGDEGFDRRILYFDEKWIFGNSLKGEEDVW